MRRPALITTALLVAGSAALLAANRATQAAGPTAPLSPDAVLQTMTGAADWQLAHPSEHPAWDWTQAAFYTGMMALGNVSGDPKYLAAMRAMGERNAWRPGLRPGHADDYAVVATYAKLFESDRDRRLLAPGLALFNFLLSRPYDESLAWGNGIESRELAWCDALFMGPPALAAMTAATGDRRYLDLGNRLWWKTTDYLYDREERLYYRDSRFFDQRERNGRKVFWSRGNGWVFAGLVRMLQDLPGDYPERARYLALYREMAEKIAAVQGQDGYWRSSLLDPDSRPNPETSGTGFFTYGLAWGINQGLLERPRYQAPVRRGWDALAKAVRPDGMLGWVQRIGYEPGATTADTTEVYGVGALLLAGSEVYKLALFEGSREVALGARNPLQEARFDETLEAPWPDLAGRLEAKPGDPLLVVDARTGALLASQLFDEDADGSPDQLLFQSSFLAGERRGFAVRKLAAPWRPPFPSRAHGRFVPERKDDFAWENDRVVFRMYGPALAAAGEVSSGIDVWAKRVRKLVIDEWYGAGDYHRDHGEGLDFYKVGPSRGCGGLGILQDGSLAVSGNYRTWRLLASGPIRVAFVLTYEAWGPGAQRVTEGKRISLDAGHNLSRLEAHFAGATGALPLAVGIVMRPASGEVPGQVGRDEKGRWAAYWEPPQGNDGQIGCGVVFGAEGPPATEADGHVLLTRMHPADRPFVYWAGAAWSKGLDFRTQNEWEAYLKRTARRVAAPITVEVAP